MDKDIEEIIAASAAGDWERAERLVQELEESKLVELEDEFTQFIKMKIKRLLEAREWAPPQTR